MKLTNVACKNEPNKNMHKHKRRESKLKRSKGKNKTKINKVTNTASTKAKT